MRNNESNFRHSHKRSSDGGDRFIGLTRYQRIVLLSIILLVVYQIVFTVLFVMWKWDMLWKATLIFSGGISMGGYYLAAKSLWEIEQYDQQVGKIVWEKYGLDIEDPENTNMMSYYYDNQKLIDKELEKIDKEKFLLWVRDTIENINNYKSTEKSEKWGEDL